jgi:cobalt-zinc-cadmium efflux system protein
MSHSHSHEQHAPKRFDRAFALGIGLNLAYVLVEALYGWQVNSLALLADAGHNLGDVGGLLLAWAAIAAARLQSTDKHTYGWRRASILASFSNALLLLVAMGSLGWEALHRLQQPEPIEGVTVMVVAAIGVLINAFTAWLFVSGSKDDLNLRGAFLHMAADALVSVGVVVAGALYLWQGWLWLDPVVSLIIALVIVIGSWSLLRQSLHLLFDGVPKQVDLAALRHYLQGLPQVIDVHDLHVWALSTNEVALTAHLRLQTLPSDDSFVQAISEQLHEHFAIAHSTLQLEAGQGCEISCSNPPKL